MWLSTVRVGASTEGPQLELDFSVASAELWEYLYRNEANLPHITKPVSVSPVSYHACKSSVKYMHLTSSLCLMQILQLVEDSSLSKPCIKLKLSMSDEHKKVLAYIGWSTVRVSLKPRPHLEWGLGTRLTEGMYLLLNEYC